MMTTPTESQSTSDTNVDKAVPAIFVWRQDVYVDTGDIICLAHALEEAEYAGWEAPTSVITNDHGRWHDVTTELTHIFTDDQDWMYFQLTCTWSTNSETLLYSVDGRA